MNDLERDLHELFEQRATNIDAPGLAPEQVLRRGRRRQIRTVAGSALAGALAIAVAVAAIGVVHRPETASLDSPPLPARTTSIGGVPVTAPAGWTLVDDTPLASLLPMSAQTCSFSSSGTAVDQNGSPIDASSGDPSPVEQDCSNTTASYPAGIPILQLANFEIPLLATVCSLGANDPTALPADGVAVYVAVVSQLRTADMLAHCPGSERITDGTSLVTFSDRAVKTVYAAVVVAGSSASSQDIELAQRYARSLDGTRIDADVPPSVSGPGYVVAAGDAGDRSWRVEAGITSFSQHNGIPNVGAVLVTSGAGFESADVVDLPTTQDVLDGVASLGGGGVVQFGTAKADVTSIDIDTSAGITPATLVRWPSGIRTLQGVDGYVDGWLWFAPGETVGQVRVSTLDEPTETVQPTPSTSTGGQLQMRQEPDGTYAVYGHDLGHAWEIRHDTGNLVLTVDGTRYDPFPMVDGEWRVFDVDGGSYVVGIFDTSVQRLWVTQQGSDTSIEGRSMAAQDANGNQGRIWLIALPGTGWGTLENGVASRGWWISWPAVMNLRRGAVLRAGGDGTDVSWSLVYTDDHCVQLQVDTSSIGGLGDCLPPWYDLERNGGRPFLGGVAGQELAVITIVLPADATIDSFRLSGDGADPDCTTILVESNFAGTQFCVFPLTVGSSATLTIAGMGGMPPVRITAAPGGLDVSGAVTLSDGVSASAAPSP